MEQLPIPVMDSSALLIAISQGLDLDALPARLDDQQFAMIEAIANSPLVPAEPVNDVDFAKCFRILAQLPRRKVDDAEGEFGKRLLRRCLGHHPAEAFAYLAQYAITECSFFPSIKECTEIIERWQRPDQAYRSKARVIARRESQARFDETLIAIRDRQLTDDEINALPGHTKRVAEQRGYLLAEHGSDNGMRYRWREHWQSRAKSDERDIARARGNGERP